MQLPTQVQSTKKWGWRWKRRIIATLIGGGFILATPLIWHGDWGFGEGEIARTKLEWDVDAQGNPITETPIIIIEAPGKSLWDGLNLLGVPLSLAFFGAWFQQYQQKRAADEAREEVLQVYFDRISALLIDENLMGMIAKERLEPEQKELLEAALDIIRARTLSILRQFENDIDRKNSVIRFLVEAEIISKLKLPLNGANLSGVKLTGTNLDNVKLNRANLKEADLTGASLERSNLLSADLEGAYLQLAGLTKSNLRGANLSKANCIGANLIKANLSGTDLTSTKLTGTDLSEAHLQGANLSGADLQRANLSGTDLSDIRFDNRTAWPDKGVMEQAKNIPESLKRKFAMHHFNTPLEETSVEQN